jgi:hypothetical protein
MMFSFRFLASSCPRRAIEAALCACLLVAAARPAHSHVGDAAARINQEVVIAIDGDSISLVYSTELNRPSAFLEVMKMDLNGDGQLSPDEQAEYFAGLRDTLSAGLELRVDGREVELRRVGEMELSMPFRKSFRFKAPQRLDRQAEVTVEFHNDNYLDFAGEIAMTVDPGTETDIVFDSRWRTMASESAEPTTPNAPGLSWRQRDVVFRYKRGTGLTEPPDDFHAVVRKDTEQPAEQPVSSADILLPILPPIWTHTAIAALCITIFAMVVQRSRRRRVAVGLCCLTVCAVSWCAIGPLSSTPRRIANPPALEAAQLFQRLHGNIYRAFEAAEESDIYDTLAQGLDGRLLDEVYDEVYVATSARGGQASRFNIRRVKPLETVILPSRGTPRGAFNVRYRWRVYGVVTHFGHTHARINEYEAEYLVRHNGRSWRITESRVRQNKRVTMDKA